MGSPARQRTYKEMAHVIENLPVILREKRRKHKMTLQDAADALQMSKTGYWQIEQTGETTAKTLLRILRWL